jgi:hypothetical protein
MANPEYRGVRAKVAAIVAEQRARARAERRALTIDERACWDKLIQVDAIIARQKNEARRTAPQPRGTGTQPRKPEPTGMSILDAEAQFAAAKPDIAELRGTNASSSWMRSQL